MSAHNASLRQLRAFVNIVDKGSFVGAAGVLNLSQPALSQCVRQLEEHVGSSLLNRTTRSVQLTHVGKAFLPRARELLDHFDSMMDDLEKIVARKHGEVTIACLPSIASHLMPKALAIVTTRFPGIHVTVRDANMRGVFSALHTGEADIGIGSAICDSPELDSVIFARDQMYALLPFTSPLARRRSLTWKDLADEPFIAMSEETGIRELLEEAMQAQGITLDIKADVCNLATLSGMIEEGLGISAVPSLTLPRDSQSFIRYRPLTEPKVQRTIRLFWNSNLGLSPAAAAIASALEQCVVENTDDNHFSKIEWHLDALQTVKQAVDV